MTSSAGCNDVACFFWCSNYPNYQFIRQFGLSICITVGVAPVCIPNTLDYHVSSRAFTLLDFCNHEAWLPFASPARWITIRMINTFMHWTFFLEFTFYSFCYFSSRAPHPSSSSFLSLSFSFWFSRSSSSQTLPHSGFDRRCKRRNGLRPVMPLTAGPFGLGATVSA